MTPDAADSFGTMAAAYVHIPFCSTICPYCDFAVVAGRDEQAGRYVSAVVAEIAMSESWRPLDAVYFGGGTPSHVAPSLLGSILEALAHKHGIAGDAELSLEANPEDFVTTTARDLREIGFNRVSFGAQSFDTAVLESLGRRHGPREIVASADAATRAGFERLSVDLIYGDPVETIDSWAETVGHSLALGTGHISCYALTVEGGTPLGRAVAGGDPAPDPDAQADRHELADALLATAGLPRYEVSNWAKPGEECRYNMVVWAQGEYEAYGNGAHGFRDGVRFRNHRRLDAYMTRVERGERPRSGEDVISGWDAELDRLFVGLRRRSGAGLGSGTEALLASDEGRDLIRAGVIAVVGDRLVVRQPLLTDAVHRSILGLPAPIVIGHGNA
ncbi:MAG: radical SAM family heme chaperone HemW [Acidimicrobiia bacterium]